MESSNNVDTKTEDNKDAENNNDEASNYEDNEPDDNNDDNDNDIDTDIDNDEEECPVDGNSRKAYFGSADSRAFQ